MYKIKSIIRQIRKLVRWIPIIWRDRDWDYYFIYEILKQKLIDQEEYIRKDGIHLYNQEDASSIKKAIEMIEIVQTEYHIDKYLTEKEWTKGGLDKSVKDHDNAKEELFKYLSDNIEKWWD